MTFKTKKCDFLIFIIAYILIIVYINFSFTFTHDSNNKGNPILIDNNIQINQKLYFKNNPIFKIDILLGKNEKYNSGKLIIYLFENEKIVEKWEKNASDIRNNEYASFLLSQPLFMKFEKKYNIIIENKDKNTRGIYLYKNSNINNEDDICIKVWEENINKKNKILILFTMSFVLLIFLLYILKYNLFISMSFLLFIFSTIFFYIFPLGVEPDAMNHFLRAYEISEGKFITPKKDIGKLGVDYLPKALEKYYDSESTIDTKDLKEYSFLNTAVYSPISYLPQSIGITIAKNFTNKTKNIFYFSRGIASITNILVCLFAIYLIPYYKSLCFVILMFPMTLELLTSISPDGWIISLIYLYTSLIIYIIKKRHLYNKQIIGIIIISWLISLNKIVYLPFSLLILLIPYSCFKSKKNSKFIKLISVITSCLFNFTWLFIAKSYLASGLPAGVNSQMQLHFIISEPLQYINTICLTFLTNFETYIVQMIGGSLGSFNVPVNSLVWLGFLFLIIFLSIKERGSSLNNVYEMLIPSCIVLSEIILISTSLYIQWTTYKSLIIDGIQGRYFIPFMPLLLFIMNKKFNVKCTFNEINYKVIFIFIFFLDSIATLDVIHYFI